MRRSILVFLLTPLALPAAPALKSKVQLYYATRAGDTGVYAIRGAWGATEFRETVTRVEAVDGGCRVTSRQVTSGGLDLDYEVEVSVRGVFRLRSGGVRYKSPLPVVRLPLKYGDSWASDPSNAVGGSAPEATYVIGGEDDVDVPAGKFKCVRVDSDSGHSSGRVKSSHWYAPRVGLVKVKTVQGTSESVQVLKSFTPGK